MYPACFMSMQLTPGCRDSSAVLTVELYVQLLRRSNSALVLMDMSAELPNLKRTKGLTNWLVKGQNKFYSDWEDAYEEAVGPSSYVSVSRCQVPTMAIRGRTLC